MLRREIVAIRRAHAVLLGRRCTGNGEDRPDPADDRPAGLDRQADRRGGEALPGAQRHDGGGQESRGHPEGRHRRARRRQAAGAGARRQRQGCLPRGLRPDADRARGGADCHAGQGAGGRHGGRHVVDHRGLALRRAHQLHPGAVVGADGRVGGRRTASRKSSPWSPTSAPASTPRNRSARSSRPTAARSSRTCACRCAAPTSRRSCRRRADAKPDALFVFVPSGAGAQFVKQFVERGLDKSGIKLIATGDVTDDDILNGMGDVAIGVDQHPQLLGHHNSAGQQGLRRGLQEGQRRHAAELHVGRRLRRHAPDLRGAEEDQRRDRRREADRGDEGHGVGEPARPDLDRPRRRATSSRTSTCARSRRWTASSTTSSSRPFRTSRIR